MHRPMVRDALAAAALLAAAVALAGPALGAALWYNDLGDFNLPVRAWFAAGARLGVLRWWCSELAAGYPLFAEGQAGAAYPPNALFCWLEPWRALGLSVLLHLWWAGVGVYGLARLHGVRRGAAVAGGLIYLLSAPVWFRAIHLNFLHGLAWLPWWLSALELLVRGRALAVPAAAACLAAMVAAGHVHPPLLALLAAAGYVPARAVMWHRPGLGDAAAAMLLPLGMAILVLAAWMVPAAAWLMAPGLAFGVWTLLRYSARELGRRLLTVWLASGATILLAALLTAVQWLPQRELLPHTARGGARTVDQALDISLPAAGLLELLAPCQHGSPVDGDTAHKLRWGTAVHWEWCPFVGLAPLALWLLAPLVGRRPERWLFAALGLVVLLLALGWTLPFYGWLARLPLWNAVRGPARLLGLFSLGVAMTSALVLDDLSRGQPGRRSRLALSAGGALAVVVVLGLAAQRLRLAAMVPDVAVAAALRAAWARAAVVAVALGALLTLRSRWPARPAWWTCVVAVIVADLGAGVAGYHRLRPPSEYDLPPLAAVAAAEGLRVWIDQDDPSPLRPNRSLLQPGLANIGLYTPLRLERTEAMRREVARRLPGSVAARRWLALWRVGYASPGLLRRDGLLPEPVGVTPFPLAWASPRWRSVNGRQTAAALVRRVDWRPEADTIFELPHASAPTAGALPEVLWCDARRHRLTVRVAARQPCAVVVSQSWYPGWQVRTTSGDRAAPGATWRAAEPANGALLGALAPAGYSYLDFLYRPMSVRLGLFGTLCGMALLLGWVVAGRRR